MSKSMVSKFMLLDLNLLLCDSSLTMLRAKPSPTPPAGHQEREREDGISAGMGTSTRGRGFGGEESRRAVGHHLPLPANASMSWPKLVGKIN